MYMYLYTYYIYLYISNIFKILLKYITQMNRFLHVFNLFSEQHLLYASVLTISAQNRICAFSCSPLVLYLPEQLCTPCHNAG